MKNLSAAVFLFFGLASAALAQPTLNNQSGIAFPMGYFWPQGAQRTALEPNQIFFDDFGTGTLDTTNRWNATSGGGGVTCTNAVAATSCASGTTANGFSLLSSQPTFVGRNPGWVVHQHAINIEFPVITGAYRAWGALTAPTTPVASQAGCISTTLNTPIACGALTNAAVFEISSDGKLRAVTYQSGNRIIIADLSVPPVQLPRTPAACYAAVFTAGAAQPQDSKPHQYNVEHRGDCIYWSIDGVDRVVAQIVNGANGPDNNTIGTGAVAINISNGTTATIGENAVYVSDTSRNAQRICDATFSWRCATVSSFGSFGTGAGGFPPSSTPIQGNGSGTTGAVVGTLAAVAAKTTYICGFNVQAAGGTAAVGPIVVAGLLGGSQTYQATANAGGQVAGQPFAPCLPASAVNTAITITTTADGTATAVNVNSWGYQQ